jgi:hypothetical protein
MLSSLCGFLCPLQALLIRSTYTQSYKVCCDHLYKFAARKKKFQNYSRILIG